MPRPLEARPALAELRRSSLGLLGGGLGTEHPSPVGDARSDCVARRAGLASGAAAVFALTYWATDSMYFGNLDKCGGQPFPDDQAQGRKDFEGLISRLPALLRAVFVFVVIWQFCRRVTGVAERQQMELGRKERERSLIWDRLGIDASAGWGVGAAGWDAIVGHSNDVSHAQPKWEQARSARYLSQGWALSTAAGKLVLWHWSQPLAYLWLLSSYTCYVAVSLGPWWGEMIANAVATREVLYMLSTLIALCTCPAFLLLDLGQVWKEATPLQRGMRLAMYILCPHNFTALVLANRFRGQRPLFLALAGFEVAADLASCFALTVLIASSVKDGGDVGPLKIGYSITAFGFLFFFGPLCIASAFEGARSAAMPARGTSQCLRRARGLLGVLLASAWAAIVILLVWLVAGGNPFCVLEKDSCNSHGTCIGALQCRCDEGWGPQSKLSGTGLCSCPEGWSGAQCEVCDVGYLGEHCSVAFKVSAALYAAANRAQHCV